MRPFFRLWWPVVHLPVILCSTLRLKAINAHHPIPSHPILPVQVRKGLLPSSTGCPHPNIKGVLVGADLRVSGNGATATDSNSDTDSD